jgi:hypothetical protein
MWAADDDEWSSEFIDVCLNASSGNESVACGFDSLYRTTDRRTYHPMPVVLPEVGVFKNSLSFLSLMQPSIFYGLHYRKSLEFYKDLPPFEWSDCYFVLHLILNGPGVRTIPQVLYAAGVDAPIYQIKYANKQDTGLNYITFMHQTIMLCLRSRQLNFLRKIQLIKKTVSTVFSWVRHHEGEEVIPVVFLLMQAIRKMSNKN